MRYYALIQKRLILQRLNHKTVIQQMCNTVVQIYVWSMVIDEIEQIDNVFCDALTDQYWFC
jgi:hypothetical protein